MADRHMTQRNREAWEKMTPEQQAAVEALRARHATPEYRAEEERVRELARQDFPPATADDDLLDLLAALKLERERQGLSLADMQARTKIDRSALSKIETGKVPNPTWATLRAIAKALGMRIRWSVEAIANFEAATGSRGTVDYPHDDPAVLRTIRPHVQ